jgi:HEAT repeat protein
MTNMEVHSPMRSGIHTTDCAFVLMVLLCGCQTRLDLRPPVDADREPDGDRTALERRELFGDSELSPDEAVAAIRRGLCDADLQVRLAAIRGLGRLGGSDARSELNELAADGSPQIRSAAAEALASAGFLSDACQVAEDGHWVVRRAVARALVDSSDPAAQSAALLLARDRSLEVARPLLETISHWPAPQAAPVLMAAMESPILSIRQRAADQWKVHWPGGPQFRADDPPADRQVSVREIRRQWDALNITPPARPHGIDGQAGVVAADDSGSTGTLSSSHSSDHVSPVPQGDVARRLPRDAAALADALQRMRLPDPAERRRASEVVKRLVTSVALTDFELESLESTLAGVSDSVVWCNAEEALADDGRPAARRIHRAALHHRSAEVRRRGCRHLAKQFHAEDVGTLIEALEDVDRGVIITAADGIGQFARLDGQDKPAAAAALDRLLAHRDPLVRLSAARSLAKLGSSSGLRELERLARDKDAAVRSQTAEVMGELRHAAFVSSLIPMLDDRYSVRRAALNSLAKLFPGAVKDTSTGIHEKVSLWKQWYAAEGATIVVK